MDGLIKLWHHAGIKASNKLSSKDVRNRKGERARIDRAMRLLRKEVILRAGNATESKGLGDLSDPEIIQQMQNKHPVCLKQIGPEVYTYVPEEEVKLRVGKLLGKLNNDAASGPAGLRNTHLKMWMGAFTLEVAETAIEHLEKFITDMGNDKMPPWFM